MRTYSIVIGPNRRAMLHATLRTVIWEDSTGGAWFTVDQPSTQFASLGIPEVAGGGRGARP